MSLRQFRAWLEDCGVAHLIGGRRGWANRGDRRRAGRAVREDWQLDDLAKIIEQAGESEAGT